MHCSRLRAARIAWMVLAGCCLQPVVPTRRALDFRLGLARGGLACSPPWSPLSFSCAGPLTIPRDQATSRVPTGGQAGGHRCVMGDKDMAWHGTLMAPCPSIDLDVE